MTSPSSKTPVSVLNEYLLKKGALPKFDLVLNGSGMQTPSFAYIVQYDKYMSLGQGRSKQEAKHQAAMKMLELLNIPYGDERTVAEKALIVPHENDLGYNAVGELADCCKRNCYPEAKYDVIQEVGPPHARIFTVKCSVSRLSTIGEARTKKEAKRIAAHKMVMQLQQEGGENPMAVAVPKKTETKKDVPAMTELPRAAPVYQPHAYLYKDFCNAYLELEEKSETLEKILNDWDVVQLKNACKLVLDISVELAVVVTVLEVSEERTAELESNVLEKDYDVPEETVNAELINDKAPDTGTVFVTLQVHPPVVGIGRDVPTAALSVLEFLRELTL